MFRRVLLSLRARASESHRVKTGIAVLLVTGAGLAFSSAPAHAADATTAQLGGVDTTATIGYPDGITLAMKDGTSALDSGYSQTVTFSATGTDCVDCFTITPNNGADANAFKYTFTPSDGGVKNFTITWNNPGERTLQVAAPIVGQQEPSTDEVVVDVAPQTATHINFDSTGEGAVNTAPTVNVEDAVTVALRNNNDDIDTGYTGTINWDSSTCGSRFLVNGQPSSTPYTFVPGDHGAKTFNIKWTDVAPTNAGCHLVVEAPITDSEPSTDEKTVKPVQPVTTTTSSTTTSTTAPPANLPHIEGALVTGAMAPGGPHVRVFKASTHELQREFFAYGLGFKGGVNVALGDINNDGWTDIITGAGPGGGSHVKVFSGKTGLEIASFFAYPVGYDGGVYVAAADVNNDGKDDVITGVQSGGGPHVKVFSGNLITAEGYTGADSALLASFYAYSVEPAFTGGVRVAGVDTDDDGKAEIITGAGPGGGPHLAIFKPGATLGSRTTVNEWYAYGASFTGGIFVGAHEQGGTARIITGAGPGGGQHVRIWNPAGTELASVTPQVGTIGATVALGNADGDASDEFVVGHASGAPTVRLFDFPATEQGSQFSAYPGFGGGITVALGDI